MDNDFENHRNLFFLKRDDTPDAFQSIDAKPLVATKKDSIQSLFALMLDKETTLILSKRKQLSLALLKFIV